MWIQLRLLDCRFLLCRSYGYFFYLPPCRVDHSLMSAYVRYDMQMRARKQRGLTLKSEPRNLLTLFMALSGIVSTYVYRETASCKDHVPHDTSPKLRFNMGSCSACIFISQAHTHAIFSEFRQAVRREKRAVRCRGQAARSYHRNHRIFLLRKQEIQ